jgi:hypothetical protein
MPDYDAFRREGFVKLTPPTVPTVLLAGFRDDPDANPLATPSGRIEIFSDTIAAFGLDDNPGHAVWNTPREWLGAERAGTFPLHLVSHQPARRRAERRRPPKRPSPSSERAHRTPGSAATGQDRVPWIETSRGRHLHRWAGTISATRYSRQPAAATSAIRSASYPRNSLRISKVC